MSSHKTTSFYKAIDDSNQTDYAVSRLFFDKRGDCTAYSALNTVIVTENG